MLFEYDGVFLFWVFWLNIVRSSEFLRLTLFLYDEPCIFFA